MVKPNKILDFAVEFKMGMLGLVPHRQPTSSVAARLQGFKAWEFGGIRTFVRPPSLIWSLGRLLPLHQPFVDEGVQ